MFGQLRVAQWSMIVSGLLGIGILPDRPAIGQQPLAVDRIDRIPAEGFGDIKFRKEFPGLEFPITVSPKIYVYSSVAQAERAVKAIAGAREAEHEKRIEQERIERVLWSEGSQQEMSRWRGLRKEVFSLFDDFRVLTSRVNLPGAQTAGSCRSLRFRRHQILLKYDDPPKSLPSHDYRWDFYTFVARTGKVVCCDSFSDMHKVSFSETAYEGTEPGEIAARVQTTQEAFVRLLDAAEQLGAIATALDRAMEKKLTDGRAFDALNIEQILSQLTSEADSSHVTYLREDAAALIAGQRVDRDPRQLELAARLPQVTAARRNQILQEACWKTRSELLPDSRFKSDATSSVLGDAFGAYSDNLLLGLLADRLEAGEKPTEPQMQAMLTLVYGIRSSEAVLGARDRLITALGVAGIDNRPRYMRLDMEANPKEVKPDGETKIEVTASAYTYVPGDLASRRPMKKLSLNASIVGDQVGALDSMNIVTDDDGRALLHYTPPEPNQLDNGRITGVTIQTESHTPRLREQASIHFLADKSVVQVTPHYGSGASSVGVVPADKRFPATIRCTLTDRDQNPVAGEQVTFKLLCGEGELESGEHQQQKELSLATDNSGVAQCKFRYTGPAGPRAPSVAKIQITSAHLSQPALATVRAGIDLAVKSAAPRFKGELSAGEQVPLAIRVCDRFHGDSEDIGSLLNHWQEDPSSDQSKLWLKLTIRPAGNVPAYLSDLIGLKESPGPTIAPAWPRDFTPDSAKLLMIEGNGHMRLPQVLLTTSGQNLYDLTVQLAAREQVQGQTTLVPLAEQWVVNNRGFVIIPSGVRADASYIWLVENPFGGHSDSANLLRAIAGLHSLGESTLSIADAIAAINRGDVEELTSLAVNQLKGQVIGHYAKKYKVNSTSTTSALVTSMAQAHTQVAAAGAVLAELTPADDKTPDEYVEQAIVNGILHATDLKNHQLVVVRGNGKQGLEIDGQVKTLSPTSARIATQEGSTLSGVNAGNVSVYCVPKGSQLRSVAADSMQAYEPK